MKPVRSAVASLMAMAATGAALAAGAPQGFGPQGFGPQGPGAIPHLDHVFLIVEENHSFGQIVGNPAMPYINKLISNHQVNLATQYYAVGHPSLTNYLELVGGSNFGIRADNPPDWHNVNCTPDIVGHTLNADNLAPAGALPNGVKQDINPGDNEADAPVCPVAGSGVDAATPVLDTWNENGGPFLALADIDGTKGVNAASTVGETIADQLAQHGLSWRSYQESLPNSGADGVNNANGTTYDTSKFLAALKTQGENNNSIAPYPVDSGIVNDYAVKHDPFAYFRSVQEGRPGSGLSLANISGFDGANGLYADLATGRVPTFSLIAPNQCDDQHGRDNADAFCQDDPGEVAFSSFGTEYTDGNLSGLNPGLAANADASLHRIVTAITSSPAWNQGHNAIIVVWDENDYSGATAANILASSNGVPTAAKFSAGEKNNVVLTVQTSWGGGGKVSNNYYNSYSVLKSIEAGLGLPHLNHAADTDVAVFSDLF